LHTTINKDDHKELLTHLGLDKSATLRITHDKKELALDTSIAALFPTGTSPLVVGLDLEVVSAPTASVGK
jgi:hypothetical protein